MYNIISYLRVGIIIIIGVLSLTIIIPLVYISTVVCFVKNQIMLWEYIGLLCFIIYDCIVYILAFKYFMIDKVYKVYSVNSKYMIFATQFKEYRINRNDIVDKKLKCLVGYSLKVKYNERTKKFFIKYCDAEKIV